MYENGNVLYERRGGSSLVEMSLDDGRWKKGYRLLALVFAYLIIVVEVLIPTNNFPAISRGQRPFLLSFSVL